MRRLAIFLVLCACGGSPKAAAPPPPPTSEPAVEVPPVQIEQPQEQPAPWTGPKLGAADAPVVVAEWKKAKNKKTCAALAFADTGDLSAGAKPRRATFVGGWAVAWDKRGLPGTDAKGYPCKACGRSAFGLAGTGADAANAPLDTLPVSVGFTDGSRAGYGPQSPPAGETSYLAMVTIVGQGCLYQVWTELGSDHMELLLKNLRFVAGAP